MAMAIVCEYMSLAASAFRGDQHAWTLLVPPSHRV